MVAWGMRERERNSAYNGNWRKIDKISKKGERETNFVRGGSNWKHENPIINFSKQKANYPRHYIIHFNAEYWNNRRKGEMLFYLYFLITSLSFLLFGIGWFFQASEPSRTKRRRRYGSKLRHLRLKKHAGKRSKKFASLKFSVLFWKIEILLLT